MKVLVTGSQGFIGSYICQELLNEGYNVIGVDDYSKYGVISRYHDVHPKFKLYPINVISDDFIKCVENEKPDIIFAGAAKVGGVSYLNKYPYDLLATNENITARTFDAAINGFKKGYVKRIVIMSSSMVFERTNTYPTSENEIKYSLPPISSYGFQKLATEYFAKAAFEQYGLEYSIVRPFNCVGVGEEKLYDESISGLTMSHVLPDLINKVLDGQSPLHIFGSGKQIRAYTNGKDLARGIRLVIESKMAVNEDFNISTPITTTVLELAKLIWNKLRPNDPFEYISDPGFEYDVLQSIPDTTKSENILGFTPLISLEESINEVLEYIIKNKK